MFEQDFTCPALLEISAWHYVYGAITRSRPPFHAVPVKIMQALAWSAFARHY